MALAIGNKSFVQFGVEASYASTATCTGYRMELVSANIDPVIGTIPSASLYSGQSRRKISQGGLYYQGKIVMEGRYVGLGRLLRAAFGTVTTSAGPPYTHTYGEGATPPSLTIELCEGDVSGSSLVKRAVGCIITDLSLSCTAGQSESAQVTVEFGFAAKTVTTAQTPAALSFPATFIPWIFHESTSVTDDGSGITQASQRVHEVKLTLTNPYALDRFFFGSLTPDQPIRSDFLTAQWEFTSDFSSVTPQTAAGAFAPTAPKLKMANGTSSVEFRSTEAQITNYGNPVEGYGPVLMKITHEAFRSSANTDGPSAAGTALSCLLINGDNAATNGDTSP